MAFPHISMKTKNFKLTPALEDLLEKRLAPLGKMLPPETDGVCEVELSKTTTHHQMGKIYRAEINLEFGGYMLRAEATEEKMEDAIDEAKDELKSELTKLNSKNESKFRRGARKAKGMLRGM